MPAIENSQTVVRAIARFNAKDLEGYLDMFDKSVVFHGMPRRLKPGVGGLRDYYMALCAAFPDMRLASEEIIADGEKLANRYSFYGTHKGVYLGIAPTLKLVMSTGMVFHFFRNGKIYETWQSNDNFGFLSQMGALQSMATK
jgi:predicted ester cyclase